MPRCARSSARCGPTPLTMRTSVLRFIAIGECDRKAEDAFFLYHSCCEQAEARTIVGAATKPPTGSGETCIRASGIYRVSVPCSKRGGSCDGRPPDRFRQARAAALGGGGGRRRAVRQQVLLPRVPGSVR